MANCDSRELDSKSRTALLRVFQETLTDAVPHAEDTQSDVHLVEINHVLSPLIGGNGMGITKTEINSMKSLGISGKRERISPIGGTLA
jgi:glucose-6-phosphate-specific signal transduction histidine kinase